MTDVAIVGPGGIEVPNTRVVTADPQEGPQAPVVSSSETNPQAPAPASVSRLNLTLNSVNSLTKVISLEEAEKLIREADEYIKTFKYKPIENTEGGVVTFGNDLTYPVDDSTWQRVLELVVSEILISGNTPLAERIKSRVLNPYVLGKLGVAYELSPIFQGAKDVNQQDEIIRKLIKQYATDDAVMRFVETQMPLIAIKGIGTIDAYQELLKDPQKFAQAVIAHRWCCKNAGVDPYNLEAQLRDDCIVGRKIDKEGNTISVTMKDKLTEQLIEIVANEGLNNIDLLKASLRQSSPIPPDTDDIIGESTFFKYPLDKETLSLSAFIIDAYERGINCAEIPADLLPFNLSKRLPGEYPPEELSRIKELAKTLGITLTVHYQIVGPQGPKTKFISLLEAAEDNVELTKKLIDFTEAIGAQNVVVHISDRMSEEAVKNYAEIVKYASGKRSANGLPISIVFENYMSKKLPPDNRRPYSNVDEHFNTFRKIVWKVAQEKPEAIDHVGLLLDAAHFNLVLDLDYDPARAVDRVYELTGNLADDLLADKDIGSKLIAQGFNKEDFVREIIREVHLNQNFGPLRQQMLIKNIDYGSDVHCNLDSSGTVPWEVYSGYIKDMGSKNCIYLIEQKNRASDRAIEMLYQTLAIRPGETETPGPKLIAKYQEKGKEVLDAIKMENEELYQEIIKHIANPNTKEVYPVYLWYAGRFGKDALLERVKSLECHKALSASYLKMSESGIEDFPLIGIHIEHFSPGTIIIEQGTTIQEARENAENGCRTNVNSFYTIVHGSAFVNIVEEDGTVHDIGFLEPGDFFGEMMFFNNKPRSANVFAGPKGAVVVECPEQEFLMLCEKFPELLYRIRENSSNRREYALYVGDILRILNGLVPWGDRS